MICTLKDLEPRIAAAEAMAWANSFESVGAVQQLFLDLRETLAERESELRRWQPTISTETAGSRTPTIILPKRDETLPEKDWF